MTKCEMMTQAHKMAKQMVGNYSARLSLALRELWAFIKKGVAKVVELVGSPKQIAWAEKIRKSEMSNIQELQLTMKDEFFSKELMNIASLLPDISVVDLASKKNYKEISETMVQMALEITGKMMNKIEVEASAKWFIEHQGYGNRISSEFRTDMIEAVTKVW